MRGQRECGGKIANPALDEQLHGNSSLGLPMPLQPAASGPETVHVGAGLAATATSIADGWLV